MHLPHARDAPTREKTGGNTWWGLPRRDTRVQPPPPTHTHAHAHVPAGPCGQPRRCRTGGTPRTAAAAPETASGSPTPPHCSAVATHANAAGARKGQRRRAQAVSAPRVIAHGAAAAVCRVPPAADAAPQFDQRLRATRRLPHPIPERVHAGVVVPHNRQLHQADGGPGARQQRPCPDRHTAARPHQHTAPRAGTRGPCRIRVQGHCVGGGG